MEDVRGLCHGMTGSIYVAVGVFLLFLLLRGFAVPCDGLVGRSFNNARSRMSAVYLHGKDA